MADTTQEIRTVEDYLELLKRELAGSDPALVQDALYDVEGGLREEIAAAEAASAGAAPSDDTPLGRAIRRFGTPAEVAEAYRATDARVAAALAQPAPPQAGSLGQRIFGVFLDPKAYGALVLMLLSLATGILYFTWAVTGLSLSLGLSVLIFGLPFLFFFVGSVRLFGLLEGRLIESLTGLRMPRRPPYPPSEGRFLSRLGQRLRDARTWTTILYMVLKLPLGILSFTMAVTMLSISLALLFAPFAQYVVDQPEIFLFGGRILPVGIWGLPLFWLAGFLDLLLTMHLARAFGRLQGAVAKALLVSV